MTISRFAAATAVVAQASSTTVSVVLPASILAGDMIVLSYAHRSTLTGTDGFTDRGSYLTNNGAGANQRTGIATKTAVGTEGGTTVTLTMAGAGRCMLHWAVYRSSTGTLVFGQIDGVASGGGTTSTASPVVSETSEYAAISSVSNAFGQSAAQPDLQSGVGWTKLNTVSAGLDLDRLSIADQILSSGSTPALVWEKGSVTTWDASIAVITLTEASDVTAPILSSPTGTQTGTTTATGTVSTDEGNGTLYAVMTDSPSTPSVAQVQAGQDHTGVGAVFATSQAVSASGVQNVLATGGTPGATNYFHYQQQDNAANDSTVSSSAGFTFPTGVTKGARITLYTGSTPQASLTGITAMWWDQAPPVGNPVFTTATAITDGSGVFEIDLDASTALSVGGLGFLMVRKRDAGEVLDSLSWAGELAIIDIS